MTLGGHSSLPAILEKAETTLLGDVCVDCIHMLTSVLRDLAGMTQSFVNLFPIILRGVNKEMTTLSTPGEGRTRKKEVPEGDWEVAEN